MKYKAKYFQDKTDELPCRVVVIEATSELDAAEQAKDGMTNGEMRVDLDPITQPFVLGQSSLNGSDLI